MLEFVALRVSEWVGGLAEEDVAEAVDIPPGMSVGGTMNQPVSVGFSGGEKRVAELERRFQGEWGWTLEGHRCVGGGMPEDEAMSVKKEPRCSGSAIEGVAENGVTEFGGVDADLVGFAGQRLGQNGGMAGQG